MGAIRIVTGKPEPQPSAVGAATPPIKVPMTVSGDLRRVIVSLVSGTGANFTVIIRDKESGYDTTNVVFQFDSSGLTDPKLLDENCEIVFRNEDGLPCLWVELNPNAGVDNVFLVKLQAKEYDEHAG